MGDGVQSLAIIGHGNWDGTKRFTLPANIALGYFYEPESRVSLCYSDSDIPALCRQEPRYIRRPGEQVPDFAMTGGLAQMESGVRNCIVGTKFESGKSAMITTFMAGQTHMLSEVLATISQALTLAKQNAIIRILLCGGDEGMMHAISGVALPEAEAIQEMNKRNAEKAYQLAIRMNASESQARRYASAIASGKTPIEAQEYMLRGSGHRRRTKRISRRKLRSTRTR
jgi:hypothetical protein